MKLIWILNKYEDRVIALEDELNHKQIQYTNFTDVINRIIGIIRLKSALDTQDEEDKQSISLWGGQERITSSKDDYNKMFSKIRKPNSKENTKLANKGRRNGLYNVVTLDKKCYSCTSQASVVLSAFKMAWLSYLPSKVEFQEKTYDRHKLFELMLDKIVDLRMRFRDLLIKIEHDEKNTTDYNSSKRGIEYPNEVHNQTQLDMKSKNMITQVEEDNLLHQNFENNRTFYKTKSSPYKINTIEVGKIPEVTPLNRVDLSSTMKADSNNESRNSKIENSRNMSFIINNDAANNTSLEVTKVSMVNRSKFKNLGQRTSMNYVKKRRNISTVSGRKSKSKSIMGNTSNPFLSQYHTGFKFET